MNFTGLKLLLGVSGSIAAHRALDIASTVVKGGGSVRAVLTPSAAKLVTPAAFEAITGQRCITSLWDTEAAGNMDHLAATKWANVFCVAPATAGTIGRLALGLADDALSTYAIAWPRALVIAPAMNPTMFANPVIDQHLRALESRGHRIVGPVVGSTACGDVGRGRLSDVTDVLLEIVQAFREASPVPDLAGKHLLITSGPTREFADPVRCITNPATGRMGVALARQAIASGARVTLVTGPTEVPAPEGLAAVERITSAEQMRDAVLQHLPTADAVIFAAAVSDWRPAERTERKAAKEGAAEEVTLKLVRTPDVALEASRHRRPGQIFVGFAAESHDMEDNARGKMHRKSFDLIVANPIAKPGAGFAVDTNEAVIISKSGRREIPNTTKDALAIEVLRDLSALLASPADMIDEEYPLGLSDA